MLKRRTVDGELQMAGGGVLTFLSKNFSWNKTRCTVNQYTTPGTARNYPFVANFEKRSVVRQRIDHDWIGIEEGTLSYEEKWTTEIS